VVGILWKHLGTPIPEMGGETGTEHEIRAAIAASRKSGKPGKPEVVICFNDAPYRPKDVAESKQATRLLEFREEIRAVASAVIEGAPVRRIVTPTNRSVRIIFSGSGWPGESLDFFAFSLGVVGKGPHGGARGGYRQRQRRQSLLPQQPQPGLRASFFKRRPRSAFEGIVMAAWAGVGRTYAFTTNRTRRSRQSWSFP